MLNLKIEIKYLTQNKYVTLKKPKPKKHSL